MELVGLPESTNGEDLGDLVVEGFEVAGIKVKKRDVHAIHRLPNKKIVKGCHQPTQKQKNHARTQSAQQK